MEVDDEGMGLASEKLPVLHEAVGELVDGGGGLSSPLVLLQLLPSLHETGLLPFG